ncbi:hypothetical protein CB1_001408003 [Camelus ferus]|nr:hypothetical protein CB1_001408003 [Camelus ferus]
MAPAKCPFEIPKGLLVTRYMLSHSRSGPDFSQKHRQAPCSLTFCDVEFSRQVLAPCFFGVAGHLISSQILGQSVPIKRGKDHPTTLRAQVLRAGALPWGELEKLNQSTDDINRRETELEDIRQKFRSVLVEATVKLDELVGQKKGGKGSV